MTLYCSCADFEKSEHEKWWEPGRRSIPPSGARCCECGALLPEGEARASILEGEVYDPYDIEPMPRSPWDVDADEMTDEEFAAVERAWDAYCDKHGWDSETKRFERFDIAYRCERCGDLADAIEDMGYCMLAPGSLIEAHEEYVNEVQEFATGIVRREIVWRRDKSGVWNPRRKTVWDHRREAARRLYCRVRGFVWYGGWRRFVEFTVWHRMMRAAGYRYHYDYKTKTYGWQRKPRKPPPWQREAMKGRQ